MGFLGNVIHLIYNKNPPKISKQNQSKQIHAFSTDRMKTLNLFIEFIKTYDGIGNKAKLTNLAVKEFNLTKDRTVYYCNSFAFR
ncbi:hypothetical protein MASR2M18_02520 [Ignavibacteria bacterium]